MKRTVAYTAIINPKEPYGVTDNIDSLRMKSSFLRVPCICFTNNPKMKSTNECEVVQVDTGGGDFGARRVAKEIKIFPHRFLPEKYEYSVWVDGKMNVLKPLDKISHELLERGTFFAKKHDKRNCIYDEAKKAIKDGKDNAAVIEQQIQRYREEGYPKKNGLIASGIIFRKHKNKSLIEMEKAWWEEIKGHSVRDQISFPYAAWKANFSYDLIPGKYSGPNWTPYFQAWHHRIKGNRKTQWY